MKSPDNTNLISPRKLILVHGGHSPFYMCNFNPLSSPPPHTFFCQQFIFSHSLCPATWALELCVFKCSGLLLVVHWEGWLSTYTCSEVCRQEPHVLKQGAHTGDHFLHASFGINTATDLVYHELMEKAAGGSHLSCGAMTISFIGCKSR